ncbi:SWIB-domain-containing protein [Guyanagaster necrorhizus]|uniref:SWIB-domain-containing protein n=1 Tax=Guyanagaster necrorhizus TaxID=856835 RepID=A0A9P7VYR2_9AGAR|nr:SWIB-domain-containing protein [Guyanagaster necrorhizus MCA 3950]KAG7449653.1 SWIB-domain-containing protein [Guyanagaster necrorhizus MCA 3950]
MAFDFSTLTPLIRQILSAPGTDLTTISAKRVRRQLLKLDDSLSAEFLKEHKDGINAIITNEYDRISANLQREGSDDSQEEEPRSQDGDSEGDGEDDGEEDMEMDPPPVTKKKRSSKKARGVSDAELARQLSSEINGRSRRSSGGGRGARVGAPKRGGRSRKSAATVDSDADSELEGAGKKSRKKSAGGGAAKGGFAKEYALSVPLAALLDVDKLSRPQVVKQLWVYIKDKSLQNPSNRREILCDDKLRAVFSVDKIDMFRMNKVLGQHLHENEA